MACRTFSSVAGGSWGFGDGGGLSGATGGCVEGFEGGGAEVCVKLPVTDGAGLEAAGAFGFGTSAGKAGGFSIGVKSGG